MVSSEVRILLIYLICLNFTEGVAISTINRKLSGVAFLFKLQSIPDFNKDFLVKQALRGYQKGSRRPDGCRPITLDICTCTVCSSSIKALLFRVAFALAFYGAHAGLPAANVCCDGSSVVLFIRHSKTDQADKGAYLRLLRVHSSPICLISAVVEYLWFSSCLLFPAV